MKSFMLLLFLLFSLFIYQINNIYLILTILIISLIIILIKKINLKYIKSIIIFISLTIIFNVFFSTILISILTGIRLLIIYLLTLIITNKMSSLEIAKSISNIFFFLKNKKDLETIIAISLSLIPILKDEVINFKKVLISRGVEFNLKNAIKRPNIFLVTIINNVLNRSLELENSLKAKGYE